MWSTPVLVNSVCTRGCIPSSGLYLYQTSYIILGGNLIESYWILLARIELLVLDLGLYWLVLNHLIGTSRLAETSSCTSYCLSCHWEPSGTVDLVFSSLKTLCLAVCLPSFALVWVVKCFHALLQQTRCCFHHCEQYKSSLQPLQGSVPGNTTHLCYWNFLLSSFCSASWVSGIV